MDLHPHEISILKALREKTDPKKLAELSGLKPDAVVRASSWLSTKKLVEIEESVHEQVSLDSEGIQYLRDGLPERQLMDIISDGIALDKLRKKAGPKIFNIGFGWLKKKDLVDVKDKNVSLKSKDKTEDEKLLEKIGEETISTKDLTDAETDTLKMLKHRKNVVKTKPVKAITICPTQEGIKLSDEVEEDNRISQLTTKMIRDGSYREKGFRPYDTKVWVKPEDPIRRHPLKRQIRKVRQIFISMGFKEIKGPLVESAFWNFDALFQPQDHPARDMHDTFYLKNPKETDMYLYDDVYKDVSKAHEDGGDTGSTGWGYRWDSQIAKKVLLRTHTTAVTARYLAQASEKDLPIKVFSIDKVFRNEAVDYKHLPEFYQVEGIVADPSVSFRNLLGILKQFYDEMGFDKVRFRPAYFPYTEMSVEPEVYFEQKDAWIELGGAGIFRPEVVKPLLGIDCPVLAWGLGLDRVVTLAAGLDDIRQLYMSDMDWLKRN